MNSNDICASIYMARALLDGHPQEPEGLEGLAKVAQDKCSSSADWVEVAAVAEAFEGALRHARGDFKGAPGEG
ncbi:hypothetical protein FIU93_21030 [Labrenzia sp. THAF35]|nr:hypothetical protein FIU93_21030 [Labrenzia sp. THAF35]